MFNFVQFGYLSCSYFQQYMAHKLIFDNTPQRCHALGGFYLFVYTVASQLMLTTIRRLEPFYFNSETACNALSYPTFWPNTSSCAALWLNYFGPCRALIPYMSGRFTCYRWERAEPGQAEIWMDCMDPTHSVRLYTAKIEHCSIFIPFTRVDLRVATWIFISWR